mmetsp:Transcript_25846/g.57429  ORF Transcript_25846/g.57429 Transcript_25846/m.57429 type:complete len:103 (-) Transcript_25846:98-406(-)
MTRNEELVALERIELGRSPVGFQRGNVLSVSAIIPVDVGPVGGFVDDPDLDLIIGVKALDLVRFIVNVILHVLGVDTAIRQQQQQRDEHDAEAWQKRAHWIS